MGRQIKVGDTVEFKSDIEQCGKVIEIRRGSYGKEYIVENEYGFHGDYIGGETVTMVQEQDIWTDEDED